MSKQRDLNTMEFKRLEGCVKLLRQWRKMTPLGPKYFIIDSALAVVGPLVSMGCPVDALAVAMSSVMIAGGEQESVVELLERVTEDEAMSINVKHCEPSLN